MIGSSVVSRQSSVVSRQSSVVSRQSSVDSIKCYPEELNGAAAAVRAFSTPTPPIVSGYENLCTQFTRGVGFSVRLRQFLLVSA